MQTKKLFMLEDSIIREVGLYILWTTLFLMNTITMLSDDVQGNTRNFCFWVNIIGVLYPSMSCVNKIYGNGMPSTMMMSIGAIYQYAFWFIFAYYGGDVFGDTALGTVNYINVGLAAVFTVDMLVKTWFFVLRKDEYLRYVREFNSKSVELQAPTAAATAE